MKSFTYLTAAMSFASVVMVSPVTAQENPMRPGLWEATAQMQMPGMPQMPPMTNTRCMTAEELKDPSAALSKTPGGAENNCKVSDQKITRDTIAWKMACTGAMAMTGEGTMTFKGDTYSGTITMTMSGNTKGTMSITSTGKRLGDCTK